MPGPAVEDISKNARRRDSKKTGAKLLDFYANVSELSEVLIERGYRQVFARRIRGDHAVHKMDFCFAITIQCVEVHRCAADFNTWAGNESAERRCEISPWVLIERLQHKHALGQNSWQHHDHQVAAIACIEQLSRGLGMPFMVLY
jgi:hypothetical protein